RLLDQPGALGGQSKRLGTGVLFRHDLQPAVCLQRFDVATEGGRVQLQNLADLGGPGEAKFGGDDQDVQLADPQAKGAQGVVVKARDDSVQQAQSPGDARPGDGVDAGVRRLVHDGSASGADEFIVYATIGGVNSILE